MVPNVGYCVSEYVGVFREKGGGHVLQYNVTSVSQLSAIISV